MYQFLTCHRWAVSFALKWGGGGVKWEWVQAFLSYIFSDYFLENITMVKLFLRKLGDMIFQITLWQFIDWWGFVVVVWSSDSFWFRGPKQFRMRYERAFFGDEGEDVVFRVHFVFRKVMNTLYINCFITIVSVLYFWTISLVWTCFSIYINLLYIHYKLVQAHKWLLQIFEKCGGEGGGMCYV